ncbi:MAG TPA: MipA/OmpV family protein [Ideonella sp.]|nr:MipA/OmpV family protein [Ideonella sp.]
MNVSRGPAHWVGAVLSCSSLGCAAQSAGAEASVVEAATADVATAEAAPALWTAGLFMVAGSHPAYPGADHRIQSARILPFITWRGPVFRVEGGSAGLRALRTPRYEMDFSVAGSFGSGGSDVKARQGMPAIGTLVEAGPSLRINLGELSEDGRRSAWQLALPLRAVFDVNRDFAYRGVNFEPRLSYGVPLSGDWRMTTHATLLVGDRKISDTFYGVAPVYASASRPAYEASAGLISSRLGVALSRRLGSDFRLGVYAQAESVSGAANAGSPLVKRTVDGRVGISLSWTAFRSSQAGVD